MHGGLVVEVGSLSVEAVSVSVCVCMSVEVVTVEAMAWTAGVEPVCIHFGHSIRTD